MHVINKEVKIVMHSTKDAAEASLFLKDLIAKDPEGEYIIEFICETPKDFCEYMGIDAYELINLIENSRSLDQFIDLSDCYEAGLSKKNLPKAILNIFKAKEASRKS